MSHSDPRRGAGEPYVAVERGERSGALLSVAVDSTTLGPALGGARMWRYDREADAIADAKRLAQAMTYKAAAAGLALGGGKGVIAAPAETRPEGELRRALLLDFGDLVESLGGDYVTAEDVGTGSDDMDVIAERTRHVVGLDAARGGSGDPSPVTALGVLAAIRACVAHRFGGERNGGRPGDLHGLRVTVIGAGHVGSELIRLLVAAGADVRATDVDPGRKKLCAELGAGWLEPVAALLTPADVLAPCALGGILDDRSAAAIDCGIVCGAANNVLDGDGIADQLHKRGITYAPDFVANAGGLISVGAELLGGDHGEALARARAIEGAVAGVLERAEASGTNPLLAARAIAEERLAGGPQRAHAKLGG